MVEYSVALAEDIVYHRELIPPSPPKKESELVSGFFFGLPIGSGFEPVFCVSKMGTGAKEQRAEAS